MKHKILPFLVAFNLFFINGCANDMSLEKYLEIVSKSFNKQKALETVEFIDQFWRIPGNPGFNNSLIYISEELSKNRFKEGEHSKLTRGRYWFLENSLKEPAWNVFSAELWIEEPKQELLHSYKKDRVTICINSFSTPKEGISAEVIYVGDGTKDEDYKNLDVKNKIVFGDGESFLLFKKAVQERGAIGIVSSFIPDYNDPVNNPDAISFSSIPFDERVKSFGFKISYATSQKLKQLLKKNPVKLRIKIDTIFAKSSLLTLIAEIKGVEKPEERIVFVSHIDESGANDNASGCATLLEIARTLRILIRTGKIPEPERTLTFIWGAEFSAVEIWKKHYPEKFKNTVSAFVMDMTGENTGLTGGSFLIEKMPDPSAIWTRPPDEHTEWGGGSMEGGRWKEEGGMLKGNFINDFFINICNEYAKTNNWIVKTNPFEGGSDHVVFLYNGIPSVLSWHFTDKFYHTNLDRFDKVSDEEMKNVGTVVAVAGILLAGANDKTAIEILKLLKKSAFERLENEFSNSKNEIQKSGDIKKEKMILNAWAEWYIEAVESVKNLPVNEIGDDIKNEIKNISKEIEKKRKEIEEKLINN
jgi:hypothetical protein